MQLRSQRPLCKEVPVISVDSVVDKKRILRKNGGPRWRRDTRDS
jgi:hypothetical protein